jgi:hypothetical protein
MTETFDERCARLEAYWSSPEGIAAARNVKPSFTYSRATGKLTPIEGGT